MAVRREDFRHWLLINLLWTNKGHCTKNAFPAGKGDFQRLMSVHMAKVNTILHVFSRCRPPRLYKVVCSGFIVSDIAIFVLKRDVKLQLTNLAYDVALSDWWHDCATSASFSAAVAVIQELPLTVFEIICLCRARPIKRSLQVLRHSLLSRRLPNLAQSRQRCCLI